MIWDNTKFSWEYIKFEIYFVSFNIIVEKVRDIYKNLFNTFNIKAISKPRRLVILKVGRCIRGRQGV